MSFHTYLRQFLFGAALVAALPAQGESPRVLAVPVLPAALDSGYDLSRPFIGRVEAARASDIGFELPGTLAAVFVDEGATVDAGSPLARLDEARLRARLGEIEAGLAQARAELELARATLARVEAAQAFDGVSDQEVDQARQQVAALEAAEALAGSRVASVRVDLAKSLLTAPWDAVVVARRADEGQVVGAGQPVLSLIERAAPQVRVGVAGETLPGLAPGQTVQVRIGGATIPASVRAVLPLRDSMARTVDVILTLPESAPALPGDLARLMLSRRIQTAGLWLPIGALAESSRGLWSVFVARPSDGPDVPDAATHRLERRIVQLVHQESDRAFVQGAVLDGDLVVADGLQRISAGQFVRVVPAE